MAEKNEKGPAPAEAPAPAPMPVKVPTAPAQNWAAQKGIPAWVLNVTAARSQWEMDPQCGVSHVSESEFDAAVAVTLNHRLG